MTMLVEGAAAQRLAAEGGRPVRRGPFPTWPRFDDDEVAAAAEVLRSGRVNYWTGKHGRQFEQEFAAWAGAARAVAMTNGTVALEVPLRALGIGAGDEVIVPAATFVATASAVAASGARPVVVDIDPDSQALTAETVAASITERTAAVIAVHVAGYPADTEAIAAVADARGLVLIEDCAQAHGARRDGRPVGSRARVAAWSFCNDKIMTTAGEGGAITTPADIQLAERCWELKDHGKNFHAAHEHASTTQFRWLHDRFGTNARLTEIQAAVGRLQLRKLPGWVAQRRANALALRSMLQELPAVRLPDVPSSVEHAYYRFYAYVRPEALKAGWTRERIVSAINAEGVPCGTGGCTEIYRERAFDATGRPSGPLPVAHRLGGESFQLPVHPAMSPSDLHDVEAAVHKVFTQATA